MITGRINQFACFLEEFEAQTPLEWLWKSLFLSTSLCDFRAEKQLFHCWASHFSALSHSSSLLRFPTRSWFKELKSCMNLLYSAFRSKHLARLAKQSLHFASSRRHCADEWSFSHFCFKKRISLTFLARFHEVAHDFVSFTYDKNSHNFFAKLLHSSCESKSLWSCLYSLT